MTIHKYTSFHVHQTDEIRQLLSWNRFIFSLTADALHCSSKFGLPVYHYQYVHVVLSFCSLQHAEFWLCNHFRNLFITFFWVSDTCYQWVLCLNAFDRPSRQSSIKACIFSTSPLKILEAPTADIYAEKAMYWGQVWAAFFHHYHSLVRMEDGSSQLILMNRSCAVLNVTCCS